MTRLLLTENINADETFKSAPMIFYPIFILHRILMLMLFRLFFFVSYSLFNKKEVTYVTVLNKLKESEPELNPKSIMLDYELAQHIMHLKGCFLALSVEAGKIFF